MKNIANYLALLSLVGLLMACKSEEFIVPIGGGEPRIEITSVPEEALFGDSLLVKIRVEDKGVDLSTLKLELLFSEEVVAEELIRTKEYGEYEERIFIPFLKDVPNGTASLRLTLENVERVKNTATEEIALARPDFPYLNLVTADKTFKLERSGVNEYLLEADLPMKVSGYLESPVFGEFENVIQFGWEGDAVVQGVTQNIPFSNTNAGRYAISFNSLSYEASPFLIGYSINEQSMEMVSEDVYRVDLDLDEGLAFSVEGIEGFESWWLDPDFIKEESGIPYFSASSGRYRVTADFSKEYLVVEAMNGTELGTLSEDGTGAVWIIGEGVGKPTIATNEVGWDTDRALCMAPLGGKKYRITLLAGETIHPEQINFKFFHQKGWGDEFSDADLSTAGDLIFVGDGQNGRDPGNLGIEEGSALEIGSTYVFELDLGAGNDQAILTVLKQ